MFPKSLSNLSALYSRTLIFTSLSKPIKNFSY